MDPPPFFERRNMAWVLGTVKAVWSGEEACDRERAVPLHAGRVHFLMRTVADKPLWGRLGPGCGRGPSVPGIVDVAEGILAAVPNANATRHFHENDAREDGMGQCNTEQEQCHQTSTAWLCQTLRASKVKCGRATKLPPRRHSHGLRCPLSFIPVRCRWDSSIPVCWSLTSRDGAKSCQAVAGFWAL